ncbi:Mediator of RNA polymerase II transcription subunit 14 [Dichanthelium oligosanthes]|uniref:Mediator of RNA polymerase II transcription subunit 14 n=1 Tax=Dichanthelium oligosanthes TaxID=888268 RepID=A0A1E5ULY5_9POAL|nr:Mediator of RNA polymerase II transcription subunit 14 [Dichanthelium oligosanthes]
MAGELGQHTVELGAMVRLAAEESYLALRELVERSRAEAEAEAQGKEGVRLRSDTEKKIDLLKFVDRTRQRMLRLHVLAKWCQQVPLVNYCQQLASTLSNHETCFTQTADSLFFMHDGLQQARASIFDVPFATEVLRTGSYRRLPKCIEEIGTQNTLFQDERRPTLKKLNTLVRAKLLETSLPKEISEVSVTDGIANLRVDGEFKVLLTLGYRGHFSLWRVLHMELLVGEKTGPMKLEETRRYALGDDIERRMANTDNPFMILYTVLHELCISLVMDTVIRQANVLRQGRWKDAIKSELISDTSAAQGGNTPVQLGQDGELDLSGFRIPGLKVNYWLDENSSVSTEPDLSPFISIEAGKDMLINCLHSSFILDPLTDKEADLSIDLSCIDVEALILKAIACNRHTRLLEIQRELSKNVQISQSPTDVVLKREVYVEGLGKVFSQSQVTLKIPKSMLNGSEFFVMGFPQCANAYYLLIQLDNDLRPDFHLLETKTDESNNSNADANQVIRFNRIDISRMQLGEDEYSVNLFDTGKALPDVGNFNQRVEGRSLKPRGNWKLLPLTPSLSPSFSSLVDEVFEHNTSSLTIENQLLPPSSLPSTHLRSFQVGPEGVSGTACLPKLDRNFMHSDINTSEVTPDVSLGSDRLSNLNHVKGTNAFSSTGPARISFTSSHCKPGHDLSSLRSSGGHDIVHGSKSLQLVSSDGQGVLGNVSTTKFGGPFRKRSLSEILLNIPSLQQSRISDGPRKRRKASKLMKDGALTKEYSSGKPLTYGNIFTEENHCVTSAIYASILRHAIKHCSLCIKYAQLTTQMDSLGIPYAEEEELGTSSSNLWLRLPFLKEDLWKHVCLRLGKTGRMSWDVRINDPFYGSLWKVHGGSTTTEWGIGVRIANTSEIDSHITFDDDGVVLTYHTVEAASVHRLVSDLQRLSNARAFCCGMRTLIGVKVDDRRDEKVASAVTNLHTARKGSRHRLSEQIRKTFRIEAVGLMSLWFSYVAAPMVHFVVEWEAGNDGCTIHVSPDQLWPHTKHLIALFSASIWEMSSILKPLIEQQLTSKLRQDCDASVYCSSAILNLFVGQKFLEDFVNAGEVASFLDSIRLTVGPLLALSSAIRPAKMPVTVPTGYSSVPKQNNFGAQGVPSNDSSLTTMQNVSSPLSPAAAHSNNHNLQSSVLSATGRGGSGLVPSPSLPFDVTVVLCGPYWIRVMYRKILSVDIRCFSGDQVWLQPATPPKGGPSVGGSLPCPQFRPFIMEHVAQGLNAFEPGYMSARHSGAQLKANVNTASGSQQSAPALNRFHGAHGVAISRPTTNVGNQVASSFTRTGSAMASSKYASGIAGAPADLSPGTNLPLHMKGELSSAFTGLGDDGGYGGAWVPLSALKKVLRVILKYLGVLWLFSQFPELLKEILGSVLNENEGALLNLDQEQPALRFFVGGYVFAVSVQRAQLLLQVLNVKRFHHQQQKQQQQAQSPAQEELATTEINEICDYFSRRVTCEPYDASRVASFITLLTLPISVLREFISLIAWKKSQSQGHGELASAQRVRVELCLEKHQGSESNDHAESSSSSKSNIKHDRANRLVDFGLTFVLGHALKHHTNIGGAAWLPYCVSLRLRYNFGDNGHVMFLAMEGSHGGKACWFQYEDWERCKQTVARAVESANGSPATGETGQGRLRLVAEMIHKQLQLSVQQIRNAPLSAS